MAEGLPRGSRDHLPLAAGAVLLALVVLVSLWTVVGPSDREAPPLPPGVPPAAPAEETVASPVPIHGDPAPIRTPGPVLPRAATQGIAAGVVLDAEGHPAAEAMVWVVGGPDDDTPVGLTTDEGRFELRVPAGQHEIRARGEGTGTASAVVTLAPGEPRVAVPDLRLPAGAVIRGRVVDGAGRPRPSMRIRCWSEDDGADPMGEARMGGRRFILGGDDVETDKEGRFVLRGLAGGAATYKVYPDLGGWYQLRSDPPERSGVKADGEPLEFRIAGTASLRGLVVDSATGEPVTCFVVGWSAFESEDGRFEAELGADRKVEVRALGYRGTWIPVQDPSGGTGERRIALEPAEGSGVLVLLVTGDGGEAVGRIEARVSQGYNALWERSWSGVNGEFRAGRITAGEFVVRVDAEGWAPQSRTVVVPINGEARLEVRLRKAGSARVRILDAAGKVLRSPPEVTLLDPEGTGPAMDWIETNPRNPPDYRRRWDVPGKRGGIPIRMTECDGRIVGLLPGAYRLFVRTQVASEEAEFSVAAGEETEVTVRLGK